jgi:outer membrane protein
MKRIVVVVWMAMIVAGSYGQTMPTVTKVLTFQDAVKLALRNSVLLNQQKNNLEYSQMQRTQSIAGMGPQVTVNGQASQLNGNSFNPNTGTVINGVRDNITGSINANINLFSGFNRINQIKQYANLLDAQSYFVNRTTQDAINTISAQYLTVMQDVELLRIAKQNFDALEKQLQQVKEQVNLGARSAVEEYNQDALTKTAELAMVQAEITLNNDKTTLTQTLLIDPFELYEVEKPVWDLNKLGYDSLNIPELTENAKLYRGDYLRAVKQEAAFKFSTAAVRGTMMPSLFAFGSYGSAYNFQHGVDKYIYDGSGNITGENPDYPRPFDEQFRQNNVQKVYGVQLSIPIFNGLQNRTNTKLQKELYENAQWTRKNVEYQIKNDVIRAVRNYEAVRKAFQVSVDKLKSAEIAFELETERYNLGVTNFVDFTNANRVLVQAQTDKAQAEYRLVFQRIAIEYAVGTLKAEDLE